MKLLNILKPKKDKLPKRTSFQMSPYAQVSGSEILLKSINSKKRSFRNPKAVFRTHHGIAKKIIISVVILGIIGFVIYKFNVLNYFKVSSIEVVGAIRFVNEKDIKTLTEKNSLGQSMFVLNISNLQNTLKKNFLGAKNIEIEKKYPSKVRVIIEERIPIAVLYDDKDNYYLIDSEGYVLGIVEKSYSSLPKIKYEGDISVGDLLDKEIIPVSVEILEFAEKEDVKVSSMSFYPKYTKMYVGGGTEIYIGYDKDRETSIKTVGALIKKLNAEGKIVKKIDLRYDKVIVLYD